MTNTEHITVIGGGTMGAGITVSALMNTNARVTLVEARDEYHSALRELVLADCASRAVPDAAARLTLINDVLVAAPADLIVEAVPEIIELKYRVLTDAATRLTGSGILTSNTSSLSITDLASALDEPERFLGMHFFQPVPDTQLTELVLHPRVSGQTVETAHVWTERLAREPITATDTPGFATTRLGHAIGLEAIRMVEEGVASIEDIDRGMQLGYQHAVGPLRMTDMVGLDVRLAIAEYLFRTLGPRFEPPQLMRDMVAQGKLGRKSGQGFYRWE